MKIIMFDFEVFKYDWMVVFIDYETRERTYIINNSDELRNFYESHLNDIWVGYNSRNYDQYILKGILIGMNPYVINNEIILNDKKGNQVVKKSDDFPLNNFDISTGFHSLKQLEGFMGSKIKESSIPFDIDRKLTQEEIDETLLYCTHDVEQTIEVFNHRREEYDSQLSLLKAFDLPMTLFTKTKAQLSAIILGAIKTDRDDEFDISFPDTLVINKYQYILDWYNNPENRNYKKSLVTDVAGVSHVFAWGGIHGAIPNCIEEGIILCCDVASLYPSIMIEYDCLSRNVTNPDKFREIRDTRLKLKAEKNPMQAPLKIVINGTYGASKDEYNNLYDPLMANNVCVAGQLLLLDLIEKIEPYCKLIQSNTDGLFLKVDNEETIHKIKSISKEWETRTRLDLEWDVFNKIYQKDVNNYIIINEKGKYKSKGAYVKKLSKIDYDLPIVNDALINYFVKDKPIEDTINECDDFIKFQKIVKVSRLYKYALHGEKKVTEKVLRVYASKNENAYGVFKVKEKEGIDVPEKIGNTPEKCFIYNENVIGKNVPNELDKQYYIDIANKRLKDFLDTSKVKKQKIQSDIKYVNNEIRDEIIVVLNTNYPSFIDLLIDIPNKSKIDCGQMKILITLNYFKEYGKNKRLLKIYELFNNLSSRKNIKYKDIEKLNINETILKKYSNKQTEIQYMNIDMIGYIREISKDIEDKPLSIREQIKNELQYAGEITSIYEKAADSFYIIIDIKVYSDKTKPYVILRQLNNGEETKTKIKDGKIFIETPFKLYDVIKVNQWKWQKKSVMVDGKWTKSNEDERILLDYEVY